MPLRTIRNETDATFSYIGSWSATAASSLWGTTPTTPAASGTTKFSSTTGDICRITLPSNHGFTGGVILAHGAGNTNQNASITVDGVVIQATWNTRFGINAATQLYLPRILSYPFLLNPTKGTSQIIEITVGNSGGNLIIDGMELYQASAPVAGRLTSFGHSMLYGVTNSNALGPQAGRFTALVAAYLSSIKYGGSSSWVDDNQGIPSEALAQGSPSSGVAGGPNSAPTLVQYTAQEFYPNTAIFTPGWMRAEAGDLWATSGPPALGFDLMTTNAQYMTGTAQWWARLFSFGILMHMVNDAGITSLYDNPGDGNISNGASATGQTDITATGNWSTGTGTWTITTPIVGGGTATTLAMSQNCDAATVTARLQAVNSIYYVLSATHATGSLFQANLDKISLVAVGNPSPTLSINIGGAVGGTGTIAATVAVAGRNKTVAGTDYARQRFKQRYADLLKRVALAITPCPPVALIGASNTQNGSPQPLGLVQSYDAAIKEILDEPWIAAMTGGATPFFYVPVMSAMTGHLSNVGPGQGSANADAHPNAQGHIDIASAVIERINMTLSSRYVPAVASKAF